MYVIDTECYSNIWMLCVLDTNTQSRTSYVLPGLTDDERNEIKSLFAKGYSIGFNSLNYDLPMIAHAVSGATNAELKELSDAIILSDDPAWKVCSDRGISVPDNWKTKHVDLIEVAIGQASLKIYGGRLNAKKMQDAPFDPMSPMPEGEVEALKEYCFNDLDLTHLLFKHLEPQIKLRNKVGKDYGLNLLSKSDAQMAEAVIRSLVSQKSGERLVKPKTSIPSVKYDPPAFVEFQTPLLVRILDKIKETSFGIHKSNGAVCMPEWLADTVITLQGARYQMGIGGLHSMEKCQYVEVDDEHILCDWDVASMYPTMIVNQALSPENMGEHFVEVYKGFVDQRLEAKRNGDKVTADTFKIFLNGSFGKFGSIYSMLYSPKLLLQTTLTGQLALLMLIERALALKIKVMSANTDGVVMRCPKDKEQAMLKMVDQWMQQTNMQLERTDYTLIASRDVNSYVAIKTDGSIKRKGAFGDTSLSKNPDRLIIYDAVCNLLANGVSIKRTIRQSQDITRFVTVRKVAGGAIWRGDLIGTAVRFYHATDVPQDECLLYKKSGNKVPNSAGCKPLMELPDAFPSDVDYGYYEQEANALLKEIGYA